VLQRLIPPWPAPALLGWGLSWLVFRFLLQADMSPGIASPIAAMAGLALSPMGRSWWRRMAIAGGFPVSLAVSVLGTQSQLAAWVWLLPLALLLLVYPINTWADAPLFPTPRKALLGLRAFVRLDQNARVLDAGCGLGHGLRALRLAYPKAQFAGVEWSGSLYLLCKLRCPWAHVQRGDMWALDWAAYDMVYVFQRPESMPRVVEKVRTMRPGSWLVSLDFEARGTVAHAQLTAPNGKSIWLYRTPLRSAP
jgi:SAM-dependent methyltransferase